MLVLFIFSNVLTVVVSANRSKSARRCFRAEGVSCVCFKPRGFKFARHVVFIEDKKVHSYKRNSSCSFASSANTYISSYPDTSRLETETMP
jgi:hypothetical protein